MLRSKTFWAAVSSCTAAVAAVATNEATLAEGLSIATTAILAIFLRHGVAKTQTVAELAVETAKAAAAPPPALKKKAKKAELNTMGTYLTKGTTFTTGATVTAASLNNLVDNATVTAGSIGSTQLGADSVVNG